MPGAVSGSQAPGAPVSEAGETYVHPTAIVEDPAALGPGTRVEARAYVAAGSVMGSNVTVGPGVIVEEGARVGAGTRLLTGTVLHAGSRLGASCTVGPYAVIGGEPMDTAFRGEPSGVVIEDEVVIREFVTVHRATGEGNLTRVGTGTLLMSYAHVSHNTVVGRRCVLTTNVQLGGHSEIGDRANVGSSSLLHQFCRVGPYAMFGAASAANQDVLPFAMARGNPAKHYRLNSVGLRRSGIAGERYRLIESALRAVRRRERAQLEELAAASEDARLLRDFLDTTRRGVARFVGRS